MNGVSLKDCNEVNDQIKKRWRLLHGNLASLDYFVGFEIIDEEIIVIWSRNNWDMKFYRNLDHIKFYTCDINEDTKKDTIKDFQSWNKFFKAEGKGGLKHRIEKKLNTNYAGKYVKLEQKSSISK